MTPGEYSVVLRACGKQFTQTARVLPVKAGDAER
jgi:hypothetical protein